MNPSTACARTLVAELAGQGVRHLVVSPGSRSAPLALAALAAQRAGLLEVHVRVDERSAAFLALGLAKATRVPAVVVTTSGTAVANLHPAVLEAHHGQVPMIIVSADRPAELRGTGANQVTVQPGLFGTATRWASDLPTPDGTDAVQRSWRTSAARAWAAATGWLGGPCGPVHLNAPLREPLVDDGAPAELDLAEPIMVSPGATATGVLAAMASDPSGWSATGGGPEVSPSPPRTLVVLGDLPEPSMAQTAVRWAQRRGYPVLAEPFGEYDRCAVVPHAPLVLASHWLDAHVPDRVVVVGRPTLTRQVAALLRRPGLRVEAVTPAGPWADPGHVLAAVHPWTALSADAGPATPKDTPEDIQAADAGPATPEATTTAAEATATTPDWMQAWQHAGHLAERAVEQVLAETEPQLTGPSIARTLLAEMPTAARLFVGSSNPVRDLDVAGAPRRAPLHVVGSRGLAGIDGCVSTAAGLALADDRPTYALMGDLTFLHDTNGLTIGPGERRPDLTVVVVNDDGGGIFTTLEYGAPERARDFERVFGTPTGVDLADLCAAHGVPHVRATTLSALADAVRARPQGLSVVEVATDRGSHRELHARLRSAVDRALIDQP